MRVALIQTSASNNLQKNLEKTTSFLQDAADQGADWCAYRNALTHGFSRNASTLKIKH